MFIIRGCPCLVNSFYADGRAAKNECGDSIKDEKCLDIDNCLLKQIANYLLKVVNEDTCNNCDGCGYFEGCLDESCGTYAAQKCLELLKLEFVEDTNDHKLEDSI